MKGERAYFNIHTLSHDPARNRFLHLPTLTAGPPGRIQKEMMLDICHGSIHLSERLRSLFAAAVPHGQCQAEHNPCALVVHTLGRCQGGCCSLPQHQLLFPPCQEQEYPSRSQAAPGAIAFNGIPVVSPRCDLFILNSGLSLRGCEAHSAGWLLLLGDGGRGVMLI